MFGFRESLRQQCAARQGSSLHLVKRNRTSPVDSGSAVSASVVVAGGAEAAVCSRWFAPSEEEQGGAGQQPA